MIQNELRSYTDDQIKEMIDLSISYRMNLDNLKAKGIKIGDKKVRSLMNEKRSEKEDQIIMTDDQIKEMIDLNLSVRKNLDNLKAKGVKIGTDRVRNLINEKRAEIMATDNIEESIEEPKEEPKVNILKFSDYIDSIKDHEEKEEDIEYLQQHTNDPILKQFKTKKNVENYQEENTDLSFGSPEKFSCSFPRFNW